MWAVSSPPSARKPITSTAPAVVLRTAGSNQPLRIRVNHVVIASKVSLAQLRRPQIPSFVRAIYHGQIEISPNLDIIAPDLSLVKVSVQHASDAPTTFRWRCR